MKDIKLHSCLIWTHNPRTIGLVANHLRYWPYVKSYDYVFDDTLLVVFNLGEAKYHKEQRKLYKKAKNVIMLCLRQYNVSMSNWVGIRHFRPSSYSPNLFLRPDKDVKPFTHFLKDID